MKRKSIDYDQFVLYILSFNRRLGFFREIESKYYDIQQIFDKKKLNENKLKSGATDKKNVTRKEEEGDREEESEQQRNSNTTRGRERGVHDEKEITGAVHIINYIRTLLACS